MKPRLKLEHIISYHMKILIHIFSILIELNIDFVCSIEIEIKLKFKVCYIVRK